MREYSLHLAGESYGKRQAHIRRSREGDEVTLVREPENPYDPNAILVLNKRGKDLGYVRKEYAEWLAPYLDEGADVTATIELIIGGEPGKPSRGVILNVQIDEPN